MEALKPVAGFISYPNALLISYSTETISKVSTVQQVLHRYQESLVMAIAVRSHHFIASARRQ